MKCCGVWYGRTSQQELLRTATGVIGGQEFERIKSFFAAKPALRGEEWFQLAAVKAHARSAAEIKIFETAIFARKTGAFERGVALSAEPD